MKLGNKYSGREIKDWLILNLTHETEETYLAKQLQRYSTISDNAIYIFTVGDKGKNLNKPALVRQDKYIERKKQ